MKYTELYGTGIFIKINIATLKQHLDKNKTDQSGFFLTDTV